MDAEFCLYLLRYSYGFSPLIYAYNELHWLLFVFFFVFFSLTAFCCLFYIDFLIVNHPCIPKINLLFLFKYCWFDLLNFGYEFFLSLLCERYWLVVVFFFSDYILWFWQQGKDSLRKSSDKYFLLWNFMQVFLWNWESFFPSAYSRIYQRLKLGLEFSVWKCVLTVVHFKIQYYSGYLLISGLW